jgi:hypothetical protein
VISFDIQRAKGASDVSVFHDADAKLPSSRSAIPKVKFQLLNNK